MKGWLLRCAGGSAFMAAGTVVSLDDGWPNWLRILAAVVLCAIGYTLMDWAAS